MLKLWHDDVRKPPDPGWLWARTNAEAKEILSTGQVVACSLDHDMGNHDQPEDAYDYTPGSGMPQKGEENGVHLVEWMIENGYVPQWIRVHAWNPGGGERMTRMLQDAGANVIRQTYRHGEVITCEF